MKTRNLIERHSFGKIDRAVDYPNLLSLQVESFHKFLQDEIEPELGDEIEEFFNSAGL